MINKNELELKLDKLHEISLNQNLRILKRINELNLKLKETNTSTSSFSKMFRKLNNKLSLVGKSSGDKKTNNQDQLDKKNQIKSEKQKKPIIKVIHETVTKNNIKLIIDNNENELNENNLIKSINLNINLDNLSSTNSNQSNNSNNNLDNNNITNRKIEDVRSRSESKLTNCQRKQPTKLKSESFYFFDTQSKAIKDEHLNKELKLISKKNNKLIKNSKEQEELEFLNKKLIAESLIKSNNRNSEMNALLSQSSDSKSPSSNQTTINQLNESTNSSHHKIPSYIGISCAISGYSTYKYGSGNNNLANLSARNSPSSNIKRLPDPNLINNSLANNKPNGQYLDVNNGIESYNSFKNNLNYSNRSNHHHLNAVNKQPNISNHHSNNHNHLVNLNQFNSLDNSLLSKHGHLNEYSLIKDSDDDVNKSLVQKRIESLYGQNFASNWKEKNRSKLRIEKSTNDSFRSPSCPPEFITGFTSSKRNLPVFKYIQNSIFNNTNHHINNLNELNNDKHSTVEDKQTKSEEAINLNHNNNLNNNINNDKSIESTELISNTSSNHSNELNSLINLDKPEVEEEELEVNSIQNEIPKINELESIKEDLLIMNELKEDKGIDELDNIKFDGFIANEEEESNDGNWYLNKLEIEIEKINEKLVQVESICLDDNMNNRDEIDGKIRSGIGKAYLLVNKKLNQFKELCNKNINQTPDEQYKTLNKDLEGFYEMVSYQIDDVHKTFDEIIFLKNNNWILNNDLLISPSPRKINSKNSSRTNSNANSRSNSKPSSRNASKEDLRRLKLREVKRQKQQNNLQAQNDDIIIFLPTNNKSDVQIDNNL